MSLRDLSNNLTKGKYNITKHQYREIFTEALDNWEALFDQLKIESDKADLYQTLSVLIVFSDSLFIDKAMSSFLISIV